MITALFVITAVVMLGCALAALRIASGNVPGRPPWLGWLSIVCSLALAVYATVLAFTVD
jgi:hypothetical protein